MPQAPSSLSQFLEENEELLKNRWQSLLLHLSSRVDGLQASSTIFTEVKKLIMSLVALVGRKGTAEQAVDAELRSIVSNLRSLQQTYSLNPAETVMILFLMRDILRESLAEDTPAGTQGQEKPLLYGEALEQVSLLLNRLGIVFFENAMRSRGENGVASQDVLAIEYALLYERTRQAAITDRLTGLYNFGYFLERLKEEKVRAERYHRLLSLIIFDIDLFKKYNDANGHLAGNEVLKKIAEILKAQAREVDFVARFGGEEMVIILPETSRRHALELAERIRQKIFETSFDRAQSQPLGRLTISAGVATFPVDAANEEELIKKADSSLYRAKSEGRNRVVAFEPPIKVTLRYKPHWELAKVALVGSFNNWDKDADLMEKQLDSSFQYTIALNPGNYHYKFVLNDIEWIPDPTNPERVHDSLGGDNSVLKVFAPAS